MNYHTLIAHFPKITYSRYKKIINYFPNLADVWEVAEFTDFIKAGLEEQVADEFIRWRENVEEEKIFNILEREGIVTVSINQPGYPEILTQIPDPPHTLFVRGKLPDEKLPSIAVVGTRNHTLYGKQVCAEIVSGLAHQGVAIVSGLALGVDGVAHETALNNSGKTIAVLGSGVNKDSIYPAFHQRLAERIIESGSAVISEYPPGFTPTRYSFPARNRIIAGLTLGTLVIEAPTESGSLITAKCALDYNREVMAIPHPLSSIKGEGCNNLIKLGATLIRSAQDVLEALNLKNAQQTIEKQSLTPSSPNEAAILKILSSEPLHIDFIIKQAGLDSQSVTSTLMLMEIKGIVRNAGGMRYIVK